MGTLWYTLDSVFLWRRTCSKAKDAGKSRAGEQLLFEWQAQAAASCAGRCDLGCGKPKGGRRERRNGGTTPNPKLVVARRISTSTWRDVVSDGRAESFSDLLLALFILTLLCSEASIEDSAAVRVYKSR